jgi:thioesterase domain-containing protein
MNLPPGLVCFREGDGTRRVVLLPGLGADVTEMRALADGIGGGGGVYALDLLRLAAGEGPLTVEALARDGLALVRAAGGADALVGYSMGGLVAFEMARQAEAESERPRLVLIDAAPEQSHWPQHVWLLSMATRTVGYGRALLKLPPKRAAVELRRRAAGLARRVRRRSDPSAAVARAAPLSAKEAATQRLLQAHRLYNPPPLSGGMTLIECSNPMFGTPASLIWRPQVTDLQVLRYEGEHLDAVRSGSSAKAIADQLNACLELSTPA